MSRRNARPGKRRKAIMGRPIAPATPLRIREMEPRNMHATMRKIIKVKME
jgi:hypothetical protein